MKKIINFCMVAFAAIAMLSCSGNKVANSTEGVSNEDTVVVVNKNDSLNIGINDSVQVVDTNSVKIEKKAE